MQVVVTNKLGPICKDIPSNMGQLATLQLTQTMGWIVTFHSSCLILNHAFSVCVAKIIAMSFDNRHV